MIKDQSAELSEFDAYKYLISLSACQIGIGVSLSREEHVQNKKLVSQCQWPVQSWGAAWHGGHPGIILHVVVGAPA